MRCRVRDASGFTAAFWAAGWGVHGEQVNVHLQGRFSARDSIDFNTVDIANPRCSGP